MADAYQTWSGVVSGVSLVGMTAASSKHSACRKMVCEERLNTMRKPCSQYLTQDKVSMMRMTELASEAGREATPHVSGKLCGAYAGTDLHVSFPPRVNMRENPERRETPFLCLCASGLRTSFDRAPAGGFLVRRPRMYEAGSQGMNVKAREAAPKGLALTECPLPASMRV